MKKTLIILLALFIIIQFFPSGKNMTDHAASNDIAIAYAVPAQVNTILQRSCYDCHSNTTSYPWYSRIQPVSAWLHNHITEGKSRLNFNEFAGYRIGRQYRKLQEIKEQLAKDEMPLSSYTLIHTNARLGMGEKKLLMAWTDTLRNFFRNKYPVDSLVAKRE